MARGARVAAEEADERREVSFAGGAAPWHDRSMKRRTFLLGSIASVVYVACGSDDAATPSPASTDGGAADGEEVTPEAQKPVAPTSSKDESNKIFQQGLASGDPKPDRMVLWTRVDPTAAGRPPTSDVALEYVIARDEALTDIVARGSLTALASADHTVRLVPTGLASGSRFHYRFELPGGTTTQVGRTKTAPDPTADVPVRFAMAACQDRIGRYWHSWQAFLEEKVDVDFIMYLGDYIYESVNDARFQSTTPDRAIKLPDGLDTSPAQDKSRIAAGTLADYRTLYKEYRKDDLLREVHRLYPFILTWDDHEFADDCWQDHSTSFDGKTNPITGKNDDEKNTPRRTAANRAFFEYQPLDVTYKANLTWPFDIKIYRQLSWGKNVDIFMTDQRAYRADHLIPEGPPADIAVGKFLDYSSIGSRYFVRKSGFDPREAAAKPSLLGAEQKAWLLDAMKKSKATWKVWGNEVQVYEMALELGKLPAIPAQVSYTVYMNTDQWDGFRSERAEILGALDAAKVQNLLVCTGDIHSFYAAELHVDFAAPKAKPVGVEYVTAGISSASLKALMEKFITPDSPLRPVIDAWAGGADQALKDTNPHLKYADTNAYGFALVSIDATKAEFTFIELGDPKEKAYGGVLGRKRFVTNVGTNKVTLL